MMKQPNASYDAADDLARWALLELQEARGRVQERHRDWLMHRGVTEEILYLVDYGVGRIETKRHRFWPSRRGDPAVILPICGGRTDAWSPDLFDLAAFRIAEPGKSYSLSGGAPWFNPWAIEDACRIDMPLTVYRSPLDWLRGGGEGAVPLMPRWRSTLIRSLPVYIAPPTVEPKTGTAYAPPTPERGPMIDQPSGKYSDNSAAHPMAGGGLDSRA